MTETSMSAIARAFRRLKEAEDEQLSINAGCFRVVRCPHCDEELTLRVNARAELEKFEEGA